MTAASTQRLVVLDALRGVAALSVCWFHFTYSSPEFVLPSVLRMSGQPGWLGVHIFFVISGVALPESMFRSRYRLRDWPRFMAKRVLRIEPPYLVTVGFILLTAWLSTRLAPHRQGAPFPYSLKQILLHIGYVNVLFGEAWISKVFWSLAVEFQYYLVIAVLFPLFATARRSVSVATLAVLMLTPFLSHHPWALPHYSSVFVMGLATFQRRHALIDRWSYGSLLVGAGMVTALALGATIAVVSLATALLIIWFPTSGWRPLVWLGAISYPLYLLHLSVGGRVMTMKMRFFPLPELNVLTLGLALVVTIVASVAMHIWIEKPAQRWAATIRYGSSRADGGPPEQLTAGDTARVAVAETTATPV